MQNPATLGGVDSKLVKDVRGMSDMNRTVDEEGSVESDGCRPSEDMEIEYDSWDMLESMWSSHRSLEADLLWRCLDLCYLFPKNYEFHKDDMIHLWMAQGFFQFPPSREVMEDTVGLYFEELKGVHIFCPSRIDPYTGRLRYRLNHSIVFLLQERYRDDYVRLGDTNSRISENTLHSSSSSVDLITLRKLCLAKQLLTLLILHEHGSRVDHVPREIFLIFPYLRVLDLSHTEITELPSSVGKLKDLRYLNLAGTPITKLPDSLCNLYQMRNLNLRGCIKLSRLPKEIRKLVNLRYLDIELACLLVSMPPGLGYLTELQTLPAFVVGKENGCHITELKHLVNLGGIFRVLRLENTYSLEEAKEAALSEKVHLHKLELQWTVLQDGFELIEKLQPHRKLGELQIVGYGGSKFPDWIGDPIFSKLVTITIHDCRKCVLLPSLGKLPFLKDLRISEMHELEVIDHQFCAKTMDIERVGIMKLKLGSAQNANNSSRFYAFPMLEKLTLDGIPKLVKWAGMEKGDFPHLEKLKITGCSKLTVLTELALLTSLQQLDISLCPLLESIGNEGLPTSLQDIVIIDCPLLKEWCNKDGKQQWGKFADTCNIRINYQEISQVTLPKNPKQAKENQVDIQQVVLEAKTRWLRPEEIYEILQDHQELRISSELTNKPPSGSLFLYDRKVLRLFRRDGHDWRKKKNGRTVAEAHERLKVGDTAFLDCYYTHGEDNKSLQRRIYSLVEGDYMHIVLVHYREVATSREAQLCSQDFWEGFKPELHFDF